ncbi:MAG: amino acid permease [Steroidobacteraceae bacterium]
MTSTTPAKRSTTDSEIGQAQLARGLRNRHVQLIAIGGTIGVGLFLGSARAIQSAGPALLINYAICGIVIFFMMRALGELMLHRPVAGSFASYAEYYVGPFAGFLTGWSYWFMWVVTGMAETTAIGIYVHYWLPEVPQWLSALITLIVLYGANLLAVRVFGEVEFWFALIKIVTIVGVIVIGVVILAFDVGPLGATAGVANLWTHGGFLPFGVLGVILTLQIVLFAYAGVEVIGMTAGEAENPSRTLPRATIGVIYRILLFYIGALLVVMCLVPWNQLSSTISPFVLVFEKIGISGAADLINLVVITAAASSCNSGVYSTGRMLYGLAVQGRAPAIFARVDRRRVPTAAVSSSVAMMLIGVILNYIVPDDVFIWVTSVVVVLTLWTWIVIMLAHRGYRRAVREGRAVGVGFRMPLFPLANWAVIAFLLVAGVLLALDADTRIALFVAPVWLGLVALAYWRNRLCGRSQREAVAGPRPRQV